MICETCGAVLHIGDFPFCPHGLVRDVAVKSDTLDRCFENLGHDPVYCRTQADLQREMDARGLEPRDTWVPGDKYLTNTNAYIDAQTLANVAALLQPRGRRTRETVPEEMPCETARISAQDWRPRRG